MEQKIQDENPLGNTKISKDRNLYILQDFNDDLLAKLVPEIIRFKNESSAPINLYINSYGGDQRCLEILIRLLISYDLKEPRIVAYNIGDAASAAAILLTLSAAAWGYSHSIIHFHGIRFSLAAITAEKATTYAQILNNSNRKISRLMALALLMRLIKRYSTLVSDFDDVREMLHDPELSNFHCFVERLSQKLGHSKSAEIIKKVRLKMGRLEELSESIKKLLNSDRDSRKQDVKILKKVIDSVASEKPQECLSEEMMETVLKDYFLLLDYHYGKHKNYLETLIDTYGIQIMSYNEQLAYEDLKAESEEKALEFLKEKTTPFLNNFWYFSNLLSRELLIDENRLSAIDAYWLGILDEVIDVTVKKSK